MKGSVLVRLPQDRFSVSWGGADVGPAGALPGQEGEK